MQTRRKNFIICVFIGILVIVAAVFVIIFCQKTDDATAEELIEFNKIDNVLKKQETVYIEMSNVADNKEMAYIEYNDGSANICTTGSNAKVSWKSYLYNGCDFIAFPDDDIYSLCGGTKITLSACDIFASKMLIIEHSNAEQKGLEKEKDGYVLTYEEIIEENNKKDIIKYIFCFDNEFYCTSIEEVKGGVRTVTKFEYGVKKNYFDCLKGIDTSKTVEVSITDVNSPDYKAKTYSVPYGTKILTQAYSEAKLYLDSGCTEVYETESYASLFIKAKKPVNENLELYLLVESDN